MVYNICLVYKYAYFDIFWIAVRFVIIVCIPLNIHTAMYFNLTLSERKCLDKIMPRLNVFSFNFQVFQALDRRSGWRLKQRLRWCWCQTEVSFIRHSEFMWQTIKCTALYNEMLIKSMMSLSMWCMFNIQSWHKWIYLCLSCGYDDVTRRGLRLRNSTWYDGF